MTAPFDTRRAKNAKGNNIPLSFPGGSDRIKHVAYAQKGARGVSSRNGAPLEIFFSFFLSPRLTLHTFEE